MRRNMYATAHLAGSGPIPIPAEIASLATRFGTNLHCESDERLTNFHCPNIYFRCGRRK